MTVTNEAKKKEPEAKPVRRSFKLFEPAEGSTRWVQPIDEIPFRVQLRFLSDEEQANIFDQHKLYPNSPKNTMQKLNAVAADMIEAKVIAWEHPDSIFPGESPDLPCNSANKQRLQNVFFKRDGDDETMTLWKLIIKAEEAELEDERKN